MHAWLFDSDISHVAEGSALPFYSDQAYQV